MPPESEAVSLGLLQNANVRLLRLDTGLQHAVPTAAVVLRLLDIIIFIIIVVIIIIIIITTVIIIIITCCCCMMSVTGVMWYTSGLLGCSLCCCS